MKFVITGASGFVGLHLVQSLARQPHSLKLLTRKPRVEASDERKEWIVWQPGVSGAWEQSIDGADGVINLAGEPIAAKRWSQTQKEKIRFSRVKTTRAVVEAIGRAKNKPKFFISGSAVGYYGDRGDEILTETSKPGEGFLADLCREWEAAARGAETHGVRVVLLRTGIVLGTSGGALRKMITPFKCFVGGPLGSGKQWMPWIHVDDEVGLIQYLSENADAMGPVNATAPNPVTMEKFAKVLGDAINRPAWAGVPASILTLALGEMADMLLTGQRALPQAAERLGYSFKYPELSAALESLLQRGKGLKR